MSCYCGGMSSVLNRTAVERLRVARGWSVADLARYSKVPRASLYKYLQHRNPVKPSSERVLALANTLETSPGDLLVERPAVSA